MRRILIIDDDRELCALLQEYLEAEDCVCRCAHNGVEGLLMASPVDADLLILDVMLPGKNGFEVLAALRADPARAALPVIMLTARGDDVNRVVGLEMGADDYLPKPFNPRELLARIRAVLRRTSPVPSAISTTSATSATSTTLVAANSPETPDATESVLPPQPDAVCIVLDEGALRVRVDGKTIDLTGQECRLLRLLLETPGELLSRDRLSREGLGHPPRPFDRSLDMQISRIRKKIGPARDGAERIRSVRGEGYILVTEGLPC